MPGIQCTSFHPHGITAHLFRVCFLKVWVALICWSMGCVQLAKYRLLSVVKVWLLWKAWAVSFAFDRSKSSHGTTKTSEVAFKGLHSHGQCPRAPLSTRIDTGHAKGWSTWTTGSASLSQVQMQCKLLSERDAFYHSERSIRGAKFCLRPYSPKSWVIWYLRWAAVLPWELLDGCRWVSLLYRGLWHSRHCTAKQCWKMRTKDYYFFFT